MSISGSKDKSFQYSNHNNLETFKPNTAGINVAQYISSKGFQPGDAVSNKEPVSEFLPLRLPDISISDARVESPQNFKYHLKKLHLAVNKILENDRITKHRTPPKKHFKGNQEAYEKMLDAVRNLSSFLQRQTTSSSSDYTRISNEIQSRFPIKVRSKSTTYDNSVNRRRNLAGKLGLRFKSVGRTASLTKRPRSPLHYSVFPYSVFDRRHSPCSERLGNTEGRGIFQRKAMHKLSVTKGVSLNSNKETENVYVSQVFTHPEVACLEAELSHRDTLIKYLSEELLKMHQDNNRIFSEYELQEASLTNHLRLLRSRLTDTIYDRDQPCTITNLTTNNSLYTGYTQSLSQHVNYNITDSIVHHFATEINHKLLHSNMNSNSSTNMDKDKRLQQLLFELQELGLATQNLLTYWEMKSREINYPSVCQHFFKALLNFFIVSMKPCFVTESNKFMDSNMKELQVRAEKSEQQVTELSCEIKNYQIQLDKLNRQFTRRLEEVSIERLKHKRIGIESNPSVNSSVMPSANILRRVASSSNVENISTVDNKFIKTDEYQYMISVDTESNCRVHGDTLNLISSRTKDIRLSKPTIMPICVSSRDDSVSNLLQRLRVLLLSKESKLKGTNLHKSKLWSVHKEEYETLYRVYDIIEEFHLNKQNSESLSSLKSFGLITPQSSLSTKIYFVPEPAIIGIDKTTSTDELFPVFEVQSATISDKDTTILTNQSTTTTMSSNHDQVKINRENSELHSYNKDKQKEITVKSSRKDKYCSKYSTKPIYFTDTYTPTCSSLTSGICKIHNYQLQVQQLSQMNDQTTSEGDLTKTTLPAKSVLRELQGKFKHFKDSCVQFVSQFQIFNRVMCDRLQLVISVFDKYKSVMSSYSFHKYTDVCGSLKLTEPLTDLSVLTNTSCTLMPLGYRNTSKVKYNRSSWSSVEVTPSVAINYVSPVLNNELSVDNCSSELSQLRSKFEALQSELWEYESEVKILRSNLSDIENHIKLAISNHHFVELQHILNGGRFDVNSLTKAFIDKVDTIISHYKLNVVNQGDQIADQSLCQDIIDKKCYPLQISHFLPDEKELIEKRILYSAQQSVLRLTSLYETLQQETSYDLQYIRRQINEHSYLVNKQIDRLYKEGSDSVYKTVTEKLQTSIEFIYQELSVCQELVKTLVNEKKVRCNLLAQQAQKINELNHELNKHKSMTKKQAITRTQKIKDTLQKSTLWTPAEMTGEQLMSTTLCENASNLIGQLRTELASCYEQIARLSRSVMESDTSLMDVRRLLTLKESEMAELIEERRHLRDESSEWHETLEVGRRDLDSLCTNVTALNSEKMVLEMHAVSGASEAAMEEECVQTEMDDVFDLVSRLQLEVTRLRGERAVTLTALERSQHELGIKHAEVQDLESRIAVIKTTWSVPCKIVKETCDVIVDELAVVDDTNTVEADVSVGVSDRRLVETVEEDTVSGIVSDRMLSQTTDSCVDSVPDEEVVSPIHMTYSQTKPTSEQYKEDPELYQSSTDTLRVQLKEARSRIYELENTNTELSIRLRELEGVIICEDKPMDMMVLGKCVADHSMKVSEDADALSKRNEDLMREVELLRSSISERMMLLNDVYIEMNEIRGSLDFLLKQVKDLRTAHIEANADQVDMVMRLSEYRRNSRSLCETVCRSNSPVQDLDRPHEDSLAECCTSDELQEDLQRALNTQSFKLSAVTEKLRECESLNNALICECESLKHHLGRYTTVTDELANDMTKVKALLPFVVSHIRSLRSDYRDWCREHEERVQECLDAVATELPHASVEHVDRECETMAWSEHLKSTVMFDRFVEPYESNEVTPIEKGHDSDLINEVSRLYNTNRELSEELCKYRDLCDKQASEIMSMQRALHQAVEQSSSVRDALAVYKHEKVGVMLELESQLSISRDECSALQDQVCRPEISMKEHYSTVSTIANRDCGLHVNEVVSEGDTAMKDLLELRARLNVTDGMDAKFVREVCRSDVGTQTPDCFTEHDIVIKSGIISHPKETVNVSVDKDVEEDVLNCMVVDGWSNYSLKWMDDKQKTDTLIDLSTEFVDVGVQALNSVSLLAIDGLSTSGSLDLSIVDQSTWIPVEMTGEQLMSTTLCENASNLIGQLRTELASCYEQIARLSRSVMESDTSLMDVRRLLTLKESEMAELIEERRHLRDESSEWHETLEVGRRDLDSLCTNVTALNSEKMVLEMHAVSGASEAAMEEECVQTEMDDVFDLVSRLQLEVTRLRGERAVTLTALERSQHELGIKHAEVQDLESRIAVIKTTWSVPCKIVKETCDVIVDELAVVDDTNTVEADVSVGVSDRRLVETVEEDTVSGIVSDRMLSQTTDSCVDSVPDEEVVSPIHMTYSQTKPTSEQYKEDPELYQSSTDTLRVQLKEARSRIYELENTNTELSIRLRELEGVIICEDKPMDMMVLGKCVADHSMKVSEDADALSKRNEDLMREVELLRSSISERMMLLNDVYIEMNEIRGSLDFLLKQVKDLRTAHIEANADQVDMVMRLSEYRRNSRSLCETVCRSNSPVQDLDRPHEDSLAECCTSDELQEDLQRALNTQSFKLSAVTEKLRECESLNNALICECESLKHHLGRYTTVTDELANDMTKVKALLPFVVSHIRSLRSDYRDWCREHEERVQECLDAVATELPHASVEHVDRECETMAWSEHLKSTVMFDRFVEPYESNEVTPIEKGHDSDLINEVSRLYNTNRELSEELCKYRDLCDKQASEIMSMQRALHQAVEQSSSVRDALAVYKHEKVGVMLELESQLSISRDECSALQDQVCRPEISMKEHYSTVSTIANRDCGLHVNEVVSEGDTAMKDLLELRARLNVTDGMDAKFVREVCRSDVGTQTPNCFSEYNFVFGAAESFLHLDKFPSVVFGDSFIPSSSCCNSVHFLHSPIFCPLCFELSELKRSYSSASLCSSFIVDFCELCICVLVIFCSIFIRFLQFSVADVDSDILLELDYLLTNILSFSELSFICPLFGVHSHVFQYFSRLHDLLKLRLFPSCISCRCTNFAGHIFIGNICISCIPFLQASNFNNLNLKSLPYVIENFSVGEHHVAVNTLVSDLSNAVCSGNISQGETAFVDSFLSERDYDCILAESERNRLCHLLWSFRLNSSNKFIGNDCELLAYQHSFTEFMNVCLSSFIDGLFKEILEHLSKSTSSLSASSLIELIHRYVTENNESVEGQNISNLSKHLYEFLNLFTFNHRQLVNDYQVGQKLFPVQRKLGETQSESELLCFENLCLRKQNYLLSMKDYVVAVNSGDFVASFWKDVRSITDDSESLTSSSLPIQDGCELNITKSSIITNCKFDTSTSLFGNSLKQQLCAFEHVISGTFNHLCNQIEAMIIKIQRIESKMNDFEHFQLLVDKQKDYSLDNKECFNQLEMELINLQRRNDEWVINVNSMFSSLSLLMTSHSYNGIPTELSSNYNTNELSTGHYSSNVLHPNEIMLNFDLFINDFQDQVNKMAIAKSQCDHLSSEIIRLQTSINRQNSQIDMYANIVNNLVAKISEISTEMLESNVTGDGGDENKIDFERSQCLNGNFSLRLNTDIGLTMEKIKVNLDQLNFLRLKLIASKQEDEMKERELEISKSEQMKILDQSNGSVEENKKNVCSTHQCAILNYRSEDIEPVSECIKSHIQSTFHYKTLLDKEPTFEQTTTSFTSTTSFLHTKQISGISGLSNLIYPRRAEKTSISELVGSVDHLRNLHELRSLAKYLLDQYHIVTSELELQSNTNWCLRQRLENANCQRDQLIGLLNKNSQALSSIEESLNMTMDESSSYSKNYDGICQKSLSNLRNKHKTNGQPFDFTRASDKYSVEYCHAPFHQATGNKFMPKSKVSSMKSRISDSDHFIINEMFVPTKMMQSVSSQTVKCRNGSCFPSRKFACGPILKRFSGRHHSRRRHQLSSVCANQSSNNPKQYSHRVNNKESRNTDLAILSIASIRSSEQLDKKNDTNTNVFTSHWDKLETGQRKLHTVSISIEKEFEHYQSESLFFPFSSSMIDESDKQFETHSLLHEYKNNTDESKKDKNNELPEVRTVKSESSTLRKHSPTSSSLSFKSVDSHFYSGGQLSVKSRKLKFHSRFINMLRSSFKKS